MKLFSSIALGLTTLLAAGCAPDLQPGRYVMRIADMHGSCIGTDADELSGDLREALEDEFTGHTWTWVILEGEQPETFLLATEHTDGRIDEPITLRPVGNVYRWTESWDYDMYRCDAWGKKTIELEATRKGLRGDQRSELMLCDTNCTWTLEVSGADLD